MKIIGCFGQMGAAKDTVANQIVKNLGKPWRRLGLADAVKQVFMESFNVNLDFIEEWKRKDQIPPGFDLSVRKSLQQIGDGFRRIQSDVWLRIALKNSNIVVSDGRYVNEAKEIKSRNGFNILLWRPGFENNDPNPSEAQIKPFVDFCAKNCKDGPLLFDIGNWVEFGVEDLCRFDYFLINDGSIDDLHKKIDEQVIPYLKSRGVNES